MTTSFQVLVYPPFLLDGMYTLHIVLNKQHHLFRLTQPVFDNYLYTAVLNHAIIIRCTVQKPKIQGKSVKLLQDLTECHTHMYKIYNMRYNDILRDLTKVLHFLLLPQAVHHKSC